nr:MAG TPA_asm: hypothetical protein [Caudoviricetes sp.]
MRTAAWGLTHKNAGSNGGLKERRIETWQKMERIVAADVFAQGISRCRRQRRFSVAGRCVS